eukprot:TRINITY_DN2895_c0_g1_i1.p4 TRINITY_DN2895_c0_g1~~TRINITY_DN2895_c0_g1_i1.p4  ORF type:complete len:175 (+),score=20.52 TRINITY_DN2895_c0_g1_i1:34-525(+)
MKGILQIFVIFLVVFVGFCQLSIDLNSWYTVFDPIEQQNTWNNVWSKLTSVPCWDSSFIGDATRFGTPAGISQIGFSGYNQWRFVGSMDTYWGTVELQSIGKYVDQNNVVYDTVTMGTWTDDWEAYFIGKGQFENQILHVLYNPSGVLYDVWYGAVQDPARCL